MLWSYSCHGGRWVNVGLPPQPQLVTFRGDLGEAAHYQQMRIGLEAVEKKRELRILAEMLTEHLADVSKFDITMQF